MAVIEIKQYTTPELAEICGAESEQVMRRWIEDHQKVLGLGRQVRRKWCPADVERIIKGFGAKKDITLSGRTVTVKRLSVSELASLCGADSAYVLRGWIQDNAGKLGIGKPYRRKYITADAERIIKGFGVRKDMKV